jgi:CTP synthase
VTLVPHIAAAGELKTKPTQHSVKELLGLGIQPELLLCRVDRELPRSLREKIAHFCNVPVDAVIAAPDVRVIYELPLTLHQQGLDRLLADRLNIWARDPDLSLWRRTVDRYLAPGRGHVSIALVGKYVHLPDSYKSLHEALIHAALECDVKLELDYLDSEELEKGNLDQLLGRHDAILVPGGFGDRGAEGKIRAIQYAREHSIPFFGICLGMQLAVVEYARNVCGLEGANSAEFDRDAAHLVVDIMPDQRRVEDKGATMRLGAYPCTIKPDSLAAEIYGTMQISERHRHRYEVNNQYREALERGGLLLSGVSPDERLVEMVELPGHPHFIGCQFHPEFKSKPHAPHPLFTSFVAAAVEHHMRPARPVSGATEAHMN